MTATATPPADTTTDTTTKPTTDEKQKPTVVDPAATEYVILSTKGGTLNWTEQGTVSARHATQAIRIFCDGVTDPEGTYVAISARSWKPTVVAKQTVTTLKLEEAK